MECRRDEFEELGDGEVMALDSVYQWMTVRHTETGKTYQVTDIVKHGRKVTDRPLVVVYKDVETGEKFYRDLEDFRDGKFEKV